MNTEATMRAERYLLPQEEKIKYVLNGKTYYYTREELKEYKKQLYAENGYPFDDEEDLDEYIEMILDRLRKYNGDPYGHLPPPMSNYLHDIEAAGGIYVIH